MKHVTVSSLRYGVLQVESDSVQKTYDLQFNSAPIEHNWTILDSTLTFLNGEGEGANTDPF